MIPHVQSSPLPYQANGGLMKTSIFRTLLLAAIAFLILLPTQAAAQQPGGELSYAVNREADMLDLQVGSSRYDLVVAANVFDTYLLLDENGEFLPWLAEEVTMSDDARVYTIRLRP